MRAQDNRTSMQCQGLGETGIVPAGAHDGDATIENPAPHNDLGVALPDMRRRRVTFDDRTNAVSGAKIMTRGFVAPVLLLPLLLPAAGQAACVVSASDLAFGRYDPADATPKSAIGTMRVICEPGAVPDGYIISLSAGGADSYASRRMSNGDAAIAYQLYQDNEHTTVWGDGTGGTRPVHGAISPQAGGTQVLFLYGQIPARLKASAGAYADTVIATIAY